MTTNSISTQLDPKLAEEYFIKLKSSTDVGLHLSVSEEFMKVILSEDKLTVKNEVEVCEMLMKWLQVHTEAGQEVHYHQLLSLIRWSSISIDYVKSKLFQDTTLTSDPVSSSFLTKVITYLQSGVQFEGLQMFHRPSTGLENCLVVLGLDDGGNKMINEVYSISLQCRTKVKPFPLAAIKMNTGLTACLLNNHVYVTGIGKLCNETWTWNISSGWIRYADMVTGRVLHCAVVVDLMLFVLGGLVKTSRTTLSSVECYNPRTNKWSSVGQLIHAVIYSTSVTYKKHIYVFGGQDKDNQRVAHVQVYNPAPKSCTLMDAPMPRAYSNMRAMLWETSVILLGYHTCFIYNFETETWQERSQFKTGVGHIATAIANSTIYIAGGAIHYMKMDEEFICTNEVKSVSVLDIIQDMKPAVWKRHAKLPKAAMIHAFINTSLHW